MEDVNFSYHPKLATLVNEQTVFLKLLDKEKKGEKTPFPETMLSNIALNRIVEKAKSFDLSFTHLGFVSMAEQLEKHGFTNVAEILSGKHNSINAIFNHYMKSDAHKKILLGDYDYIGIGIVDHNHKLYSCIILANHNK